MVFSRFKTNKEEVMANEEWKEVEPGGWSKKQRIVQIIFYMFLALIFFRGCSDIVFGGSSTTPHELIVETKESPILQQDKARTFAQSYVWELLTWDGQTNPNINKRRERLANYQSFFNADPINLANSTGKSQVISTNIHEIRLLPSEKAGEEKAHIIVNARVRQIIQTEPNGSEQPEIHEDSIFVGVPINYIDGKYGIYEQPYIAPITIPKTETQSFTPSGSELPPAERSRISEMLSNFFRVLATGTQMEIDYYLTGKLSGKVKGYYGAYEATVRNPKIYRSPTSSKEVLVYTEVQLRHPQLGFIITNNYTIILTEQINEGRVLVDRIENGFYTLKQLGLISEISEEDETI